MVGVSSSRSSAGVWEVRSACRLAMKYGRSPGRAKLALIMREMRSLASMGTGVPASLRRMAAIASERAARTGGVFEPSSAPPTELPARRSPPPSGLDPCGLLVSGPGWISGSAFAGYGAFTARSGCRLTADVRSHHGPVTGRMYSGDVPGAPFIVDTHGSRLSFTIGPGRHYPAADDGEAVGDVSGMGVDGRTG